MLTHAKPYMIHHMTSEAVDLPTVNGKYWVSLSAVRPRPLPSRSDNPTPPRRCQRRVTTRRNADSSGRRTELHSCSTIREPPPTKKSEHLMDVIAVAYVSCDPLESQLTLVELEVL